MPASKRVRLIQGETVPIPVSERIDGRAELTREGTATVNDGSWLARMIKRGDLQVVSDDGRAPPAPAKGSDK